MKKCPQCHAQYDDQMNYCLNDGQMLEEVPIATDSSSTIKQSSEYSADVSQEPLKPIPPKRGCLKRILIGVVVIFIALFAFYRYLINATTYLRTEPSAIDVAKGGGTCKVEIDYNGFLWVLNHKPAWTTIVENDDDFDLSVEANTTGQPREGSITIQSGKCLAQVMIKQRAYATRVKAASSFLNFEKEGKDVDIHVESDGCAWFALFTNWMKVIKLNDSTMRVKCPANDGDYRTGKITVKEDNASYVINVTQSGKCPTCHGGGYVTCDICYGLGGFGYGWSYSICGTCGEKGKVKCKNCNGSGFKQ